MVDSSSLRWSSFPTSHLTTWFKTPFLFTSFPHFHVINYSQIRSTPTSVTVFLLSQILSTCPMSRSHLVFRRWFVGDEIIYYTITCSFVYPPTVLRQFRRGSLLNSDMSSGDLVSSCRGRLSIGNLQGHMPWVLDGVPFTSHVETDSIIQDHHISDSSQIFSGCSFRCTCWFQVAHVMLVREISATVHTVTMCVCVRHIPQLRALFLPEHDDIIQAHV